MTHSLHRKGSPDELRDDYVVLVTPAVGVNHFDSKDKLRKILDKIFELEPTNIGSYETGTIFAGASLEEIKKQLSETPRVRCCFNDKDKIRKFIKFMIQEDFGLSVTISGMMEEIRTITSELNIEPHSVNLSLGVFGKTDLLPKEEVVELVSLCGHGMVSSAMVESLIVQVGNDALSAEDAAKQMAKPCVCGIFNTSVACNKLKKLAGSEPYK